MEPLFYDVQKKYGKAFRQMWREIFADPVTYEEFYFTNVYPDNQVLVCRKKDEITGMLHLNPYTIQVNETVFPLHYIVGVATLEKYRRQGIMRKLLCQVMNDMADQGEIFTYLMPAKKEYYEPFDFVFVQRFEEQEYKPVSLKAEKGSMTLQPLQETAYEDAAAFVNEFCKERYGIFTKFDVAYLKLLYEEVSCEQGEILIEKEHNKITGFCCYGQDEDGVYVRQVFSKDMDKMTAMIRQKFSDRSVFVTLDRGCNGNGASIMARILRLDLLLPVIKGTSESRFVIRIVDEYVKVQNGTFEFFISKNGCRIVPTNEEADRCIHIRDLSKILFGFDHKCLLEQYPEFRNMVPAGPVMIGEIV